MMQQPGVDAPNHLKQQVMQKLSDLDSQSEKLFGLKVDIDQVKLICKVMQQVRPRSKNHLF